MADVESVPADSARIYQLLWQIENWFRSFAYVELRSRDSKWKEHVVRHSGAFVRAVESDKRMHHMVTTHEDPLSFVSLGELWQLMTAKENWKLFSAYFPPREIAEANVR